ncbi:CVNH domain-containing protein [Mucilaginibacter agri]|uniref:Cyanovirin-N domain-containing protein n=1 Tax=Mucilaginibacter agri TaxID=2695265 RepID=A0A965ZFU2_9SPHI|nr:CVNH domain-containing protein [Mucilaginibacter agri]NCD70263.1 hypothetical protein [Mucilaginibacter agri]
MEPTPLNQESIQNALDQLRNWFPEQASAIKKYNDELVDNILKDTEPDPNSPLGKIAELPVSEVSIESAPANKMAATVQALKLPGKIVSDSTDDELFSFSTGFTPCEFAVGKAMVSAGFFVLSMVGINGSAHERVVYSFLQEFRPVADKFMRLFNSFDAAVGFYEKAKVFFKIAGGLYKASCLKMLIKTWAEEANWFDWASTAAIAIAQFTVWFATEGIAFIAEVALLLASAGFLIADIVKAVNVCTADECTPAKAPVENFTPAGSFINSADNVLVTLFAQCKNKAGVYVDSTLNITNIATIKQVDNADGKLVFAPATGSKATTFTPNGSYRSSSQNIKVTLSAACKNMQGNTVNSVLDITDLALSKEIANANGQLKVEGQ